MKNNNETIFDAWQSTINNMTNSWRNAATQWNGDQHNNMENLNRTTIGWMDNSRSFMEQLWMPILKQMQDNLVNPAQLWNMFNPGIYRPFMNQLSGWYTEMVRNAQRNSAPFFEPSTLMNFPDGQHSIKLIEYTNRYFNRVAELQFLLLNTAYSAWNKVVNVTNEKVKNGAGHTNYSDFYNEWSAINEQEYANVFHSKEFLMLQEELIRINAELMRVYGRQMEETVKQPMQEQGQEQGQPTSQDARSQQGGGDANKAQEEQQRPRQNKREREVSQS